MYVDQTTLANDSGFQKQIQSAAATYGLTVASEPNTTPYHIQRAAYASRFLQAPTSWASGLALTAIAFDPSLTTTSADAHILAAVTGAWNAAAGAY